MRSMADMRHGRAQEPGTDVWCPAGCGTVVVTLAGNEAIYPRGRSAGDRTAEGACPGCGRAYSFSVTVQR